MHINNLVLVFDVGNTHIVIAVFLQQALLAKWRISTKDRHTADSYFAILKPLCEVCNIDYNKFNAVVIGSVVPQLDNVLKELSTKYFNCQPFFILEENSNINNVLKIGADRVANLVEGVVKWPERNLLIVDIGTATTFDLISHDGNYLGGVISPGPEVIIEAFSKSAALLHSTSLKNPGKVVTNTLTTAMQSGMFFGYLGLLDNIVAKIIQEKQLPFTIIITGGLCEILGREMKAFHFIDPDLTIRGLLKIYNKCNLISYEKVE